ncbi:MAG TPA: hypothetical protein VNC22_22970 [Sporichthya sp.]|jgi:hypothetical protein|nr:hypothetical protein [Sporichthya sp.]
MRRAFYLGPFLLLLLGCLPPFRGPSPKPLPNPYDGHHWRLNYCAPNVRCIVWIDHHTDGAYVLGPVAPQYGWPWCQFKEGDEYVSEGDFKTTLPPPPFCP